MERADTHAKIVSPEAIACEAIGKREQNTRFRRLVEREAARFPFAFIREPGEGRGRESEEERVRRGRGREPARNVDIYFYDDLIYARPPSGCGFYSELVGSVTQRERQTPSRGETKRVSGAYSIRRGHQRPSQSGAYNPARAWSR